MHIAVVCPSCQTRYQLDPSLRGKRMRCPNVLCGEIFEVRVEPTPSTPPPPSEAKAPPVLADAEFPGDDSDGKAPSTPVTISQEKWVTPPIRTAEPKQAEIAPARPRRRWAIWSLLAMLLVLGVVAGGAFWQVRGRFAQNEEKRWQEAESLYQQHDFAEARLRLQKLMRDYPDSSQLQRYRFLAELSDVRRTVYANGEDADGLQHVFEQLVHFLQSHSNEPRLAERHGEIWSTLNRLADTLTRQAESKHDAQALKSARQLATEAAKYQPPEGSNPAEVEAKRKTDFVRIEKRLAEFQQRENVLIALRGLMENTTGAGVRQGRSLVEVNGLERDPEATMLLQQLVNAHRSQVRFTQAEPEDSMRIIDEDALQSLTLAPLVGDAILGPEQNGIVLALARGVLYGLTPGRGEIRWARRVGVDQRQLPLRVPADTVMPEMVLAISSDSRSVTAVSATSGELLWQRVLSEPCLGQPVLIDHHLLVPSLSGRVDELEISAGRLLGSYQLGQPLLVGGVRQPGTPFVYFPAEEYCVYILDVSKRSCVTILYTQHGAGSLRSLPTILSTEDEQKGGALLVMPIAEGKGETDLWVYALPIRSADQKPIPLSAKVPGEARFVPWHDDAKLALATDAGYLSLWGRREKGNRDPILFPLLPEPSQIDPGNLPAQAQVVHGDAQNFWTLTRGRLHRLQLAFPPKLIPSWPNSLLLGSPLHDAQRRFDDSDFPTLYLTTQHVRRPICWATAIDAEAGRIVWQRQLGCVALHPPIPLGQSWLLRDPSGVVLLDPALIAPKKPWQSAGELVYRESGVSERSIFLPQGPDVLQLSWPNTTPKLQVVRFQTKQPKQPEQRSFTLPSLPLGTPALATDALLLPLTNGVLTRLRLTDGTLLPGPDWRGEGVNEEELGHVVGWGESDFLITDGNRTLTLISWPIGPTWEKRANLQLSARILAAPLLIPSATGEPRIAVADAANTVTLLDGRLQILRSWSLSGKITAGPFVRANRIGCIVGRDRLVWLDPTQERPLWEYNLLADIVGEPTLIANRLILADVAGQFRALDPTTGHPLGLGYTLKANIPPAAAPIAFDAERLLIPLSDGTMVLLPIELLLR